MKSRSSEVPICNICLEPIYHFICPDCLHDQVKHWLKDNASYLIPQLEEVADDIRENLLRNSENRVQCILCKKEKTGFVCPFCFIREIYSTLKDFDKAVADKLSNLFNFDFQGTGFYSVNEDSKNFKPVIDMEDKEIKTGICESCETLPEDLKPINGEFVCEDCRFNILK